MANFWSKRLSLEGTDDKSVNEQQLVDAVQKYGLLNQRILRLLKVGSQVIPCLDTFYVSFISTQEN